MDTPADIIASLGKERIAAHLGVAVRRVDRVRYEPAIPASWYAGMCELAGCDLPRDAFSFVRRNPAP